MGRKYKTSFTPHADCGDYVIVINADKAIRAEQRNIAMNEDFMAAGGGIAKMAGDRSGPPPQSGPNSQGLQGLFNRAMKIKE